MAMTLGSRSRKIGKSVLHKGVADRELNFGSTRGKEKDPRKASRVKYLVPVPQTDTGGWVEYTKVNERNFLKELGKTAAVTSG